MPEALEEADIRAHLRNGAAIVGALVVVRSETDFALYLRPNWVQGRGYTPLATWRGRAVRSFRTMDGCLRWLRRFGFSGRVTLYPIGDPDLRQFGGIDGRDRDAEGDCPDS